MIAIVKKSALDAANQPDTTNPVLVPFSATVVGQVGGRDVLCAGRGLRLDNFMAGSLFFLPPTAVDLRHVRASETIRIDDIGLAVHLHLAGGGRIARDAIWYYPGPDPELAPIAGMLCVDAGRFDSFTVDDRPAVAGKFPGSWLLAAPAELALASGE